MADYGFQIFKNDGSLNLDHNSITSRWLGSGNVPPHKAQVGREFVWNNINFAGGTPFAYAVPDVNAPIPAGKLWFYALPQIEVGPNWVKASFTTGNLSYPDDTYGEGWVGGFTVHWGLYSG